ncbi:hypothetical protein T492DRAFT_960759 [Pavlovales sp. CCMP2436]|nr:hypothetical protein T492DRAFT_960759 [Pavlovales sp. CCMP2436]
MRSQSLVFLAAALCLGQAEALVGAGVHSGRALRRTAVRRTATAPRSRLLLSTAPKVTAQTADLNDIELAEQITALDKAAKELRQSTADSAYDNAQLLGWCAAAQTYNGRFAMFFFVVGLLTEQFTGQSVPQQIVTMLRVSGVLPPS